MPEASVIRRVRALSGFIGRKAFCRRTGKYLVKGSRSTRDMLDKLPALMVIGSSGILGGGVKSVDIEKNTKGEGSYLGNS